MIASLLAMGVAVVSGHVCWRQWGPLRHPSPLECVGHALPLAVVLVGVVMLVGSSLGVGYTMGTLLAPLALLAVATLVVSVRGPRRPSAPAARPGVVGRFALAVIATEAILIVADVLASPSLADWDAWAIWGMKAKAFFVDGDLRGYLSRASSYEFSWPARPCLSSLAQAFVYTALGRVDEGGARLFQVALWASLLVVFWANLRRRFGVDRALVWTAILATVPNLTYQASAGVGNPALGLYLFAAFAAFEAWAEEPRPLRMLSAASLLAGAGLARDEGLPLGALLLVALLLVRPPLPRRRMGVWLAVVAFAAVVPHVLWVRLAAAYGARAVPGIHDYWAQGALLERLLAHARDLPAIFAAIGGELARPDVQARSSPLEQALGVSLFWPLFALALVAFRAWHHDRGAVVAAMVVVGGLLGYTAGFVLFDYRDLPDLLDNWVFVLDRHAIALVPLALRVTASAFNKGGEPASR